MEKQTWRTNSLSLSDRLGCEVEYLEKKGWEIELTGGYFPYYVIRGNQPVDVFDDNLNKRVAVVLP